MSLQNRMAAERQRELFTQAERLNVAAGRCAEAGKHFIAKRLRAEAARYEVRAAAVLPFMIEEESSR